MDTLQSRVKGGGADTSQTPRPSARVLPALSDHDRLLFGTVSDLVFLVDDSSDQIVEANPSAVSLTGVPLARLRGSRFGSLVQCLPLSPGGGAEPGEPTKGVGEIRRHDAERVPVSATARRLSRGGQVFRLVVLQPRGSGAGFDGASPQPRGGCPRASEQSGRSRPFPAIVGQSRPIRDICRLIGQVAPTDTTVLVQGENGTGKEVVARTIHRASRRHSRPFVRVNCAALAEGLLESELFGHIKGAFTGAIRERRGRFREADTGTILLDEIGNMSLGGQARLLRVLQERELEPVGSSTSVKVDIRVIATTNVDLVKAVGAGAFREDLYYRLSVVAIQLPPLRERRDDVPLLAENSLRASSERIGKTVEGFSLETLALLTAYPWPGNVRELENAVEHALVVEVEDRIHARSLPARIRDHPRGRGMGRGNGLRERVNVFERQVILDTLRETNWVRRSAARALGIDPRNFNYFLRKHDITGPRLA
jgi:DNA-binding NtrC family response regulator